MANSVTSETAKKRRHHYISSLNSHFSSGLYCLYNQVLCFFSAVLSLFYLMMVYNPRSNCIKYFVQLSVAILYSDWTARAKNKHEVDSTM